MVFDCGLFVFPSTFIESRVMVVLLSVNLVAHCQWAKTTPMIFQRPFDYRTHGNELWCLPENCACRNALTAAAQKSPTKCSLRTRSSSTLKQEGQQNNRCNRDIYLSICAVNRHQSINISARMHDVHSPTGATCPPWWIVSWTQCADECASYFSYSLRIHGR